MDTSDVALNIFRRRLIRPRLFCDGAAFQAVDDGALFLIVCQLQGRKNVIARTRNGLA